MRQSRIRKSQEENPSTRQTPLQDPGSIHRLIDKKALRGPAASRRRSRRAACLCRRGIFRTAAAAEFLTSQPKSPQAIRLTVTLRERERQVKQTGQCVFGRDTYIAWLGTAPAGTPNQPTPESRVFGPLRLLESKRRPRGAKRWHGWWKLPCLPSRVLVPAAASPPPPGRAEFSTVMNQRAMKKAAMAECGFLQ